MIILAIESSCDETSIAILKDKKLRAHTIASQIDIHKSFGGVVPEIASRHHDKIILSLIEKTLVEASLKLEDLDCIAVTHGPGLLGSLLVGLQTAKGLALSLGIPIIGINHIEGHLLSALFEHAISFPFIGLIISGGHCILYEVRDFGKYIKLGGTLDDAPGEAYDKVARLLNLGYPGGPIVEKRARDGKADLKFPIPLSHDHSYNFSFSGLKTAVLNYLKKEKIVSDELVNSIAFSFQKSLIEALQIKTFKALADKKISRLVVTGGVASNNALREKFQNEGAKSGIAVYFPRKILCTDNAAMIGYVAYEKAKRGLYNDLMLEAFANLELNSHL